MAADRWVRATLRLTGKHSNGAMPCHAGRRPGRRTFCVPCVRSCRIAASDGNRGSRISWTHARPDRPVFTCILRSLAPQTPYSARAGRRLHAGVPREGSAAPARAARRRHRPLFSDHHLWRQGPIPTLLGRFSTLAKRFRLRGKPEVSGAPEYAMDQRSLPLRGGSLPSPTDGRAEHGTSLHVLLLPNAGRGGGLGQLGRFAYPLGRGPAQPVSVQYQNGEALVLLGVRHLHTPSAALQSSSVRG